MQIENIGNQLGLSNCIEFDVNLLIPEEKIRNFCSENKCGNFDNNYMCPPLVGSIAEIRSKLQNFHRGVLLQYSRPVDVKGDHQRVIQTQKDFHHKVLELEAILIDRGETRVWSMIGGNCKLCETCKAKTGEPCLNPDKARMSLEAIGIDVLGLLDKLGLDNQFHKDKITWTGCILMPKKN